MRAGGRLEPFLEIDHVEIYLGGGKQIGTSNPTEDLDIDSLVVAEAFVGKNLVMKRFASRARGRSSRIMKPFSEITIVVREAGEAA